jgi:NAD+ kinase
LTSKDLQLVVREPYTPHGERYDLRRVLIPSTELLVVRSKMHEAKLFVDGPNRSLDVRFGDVLEFSRAPEELTVLGISPTRRWGHERKKSVLREGASVRNTARKS